MQKDWAGTVPVGVERTKQTLEKFRRQISRTECGERGVWEKAQVSGMRTGWMLGLLLR